MVGESQLLRHGLLVRLHRQPASKGCLLIITLFRHKHHSDGHETGPCWCADGTHL